MSYLRVIAASIRVGWARDFGWTNPVVGFSLRTIAPIASTMTALTILYIGLNSPGSPRHDPSQLPFMLAYILLGATLYAHISAYAWVPTLAIAEGKWTNVFPQVYVSPKSSPPYLAGRCLASFASSTVTSIASLVGAFFISLLIFNVSIPFVVTPLSASLLALALIINIFGSVGLGFMLGAYAIFASKFEWALPTYVAGLLMIFSEALFPVTLLPHPLSDIGNVMPFTEFIRASRAAVLPGGSFSMYWFYLGLCAIGGIIFLAVGLLAFKAAEKRARRLGVLDRKLV
ncbi:MAG TPA: ABC transporter permease [Candidatus Bathyarchaeia archaeon]|nr:ABC transporter permease [Candidatus Bathyarchaeia archaeon]